MSSEPFLEPSRDDQTDQSHLKRTNRDKESGFYAVKDSSYLLDTFNLIGGRNSSNRSSLSFELKELSRKGDQGIREEDRHISWNIGVSGIPDRNEEQINPVSEPALPVISDPRDSQQQILPNQSLQPRSYLDAQNPTPSQKSHNSSISAPSFSSITMLYSTHYIYIDGIARNRLLVIFGHILLKDLISLTGLFLFHPWVSRSFSSGLTLLAALLAYWSLIWLANFGSRTFLSKLQLLPCEFYVVLLALLDSYVFIRLGYLDVSLHFSEIEIWRFYGIWLFYAVQAAICSAVGLLVIMIIPEKIRKIDFTLLMTVASLLSGMAIFCLHRHILVVRKSSFGLFGMNIHILNWITMAAIVVFSAYLGAYKTLKLLFGVNSVVRISLEGDDARYGGLVVESICLPLKAHIQALKLVFNGLISALDNLVRVQLH